MSRLYSPVTAAFLLTTLSRACRAGLATIGEDIQNVTTPSGDLGIVEKALRHRVIPSDVASDLSEVAFGFENTSARADDSFEWHKQLKGLMGPQQLGDLAFIGCLSGGDDEKAVFYVIYHDGDRPRAYIPVDGNSHDPSTGRAATSRTTPRRFDAEAMHAEIKRHIKRLPGSPDAPADPTPAVSLHPMFAGMIAPKERRTITRSEAQKMLDEWFDPTFMSEDQRIDIKRLDNAAVANLLMNAGLAAKGEIEAVIDDPEQPATVGSDQIAVEHPDAVRLALDDVQKGIADRLSGLLNHAAMHGIGLRLIDGHLCAFNTAALGDGEAERTVARHFRVLGTDAEISVVVPDLPAPRHDEAKTDEATPVDIMAPLRSIVDEAKAVLTKRRLSIEDLSDHDVIAAALKFNGISARVRDDLSRVEFGLDDVVLSPTSRVPASIDLADILGEKGLPEGTVFFGMLGARKGYTPVYFVLWHDGKQTRAYVPQDGNAYDVAFDTALASGRHDVAFDCAMMVHDLRTHFVNI